MYYKLAMRRLRAPPGHPLVHVLTGLLLVSAVLLLALFVVASIRFFTSLMDNWIYPSFTVFTIGVELD